MDHSCNARHPDNTLPTDQEDVVDLVSSSSSENSDLEETFSIEDFEILENQS